MAWFRCSDGYRESVYVPENGILTEVLVHDGQEVGRGQDLARFRNPQFEFDRQQIEKERDAAAAQLTSITGRLADFRGDLAARAKLEQDRNDADNAFKTAKAQLARQEKMIGDSEILKAPRAGMVMGTPKKEDINRMWEKAESQPFCTVGDVEKLRVLMPVNAADYREIRQNLERVRREHPDAPYLEVSILAKNRSDHEFTGRITRVPDTDEKNVPLPLTHRGGGTLATKPGGDPNVNTPMVQTFLVAVEIIDPDPTLVPGTLATAKVHLKWRSGAWWVWRSIASSLDVGLW